LAKSAASTEGAIIVFFILQRYAIFLKNMCVTGKTIQPETRLAMLSIQKHTSVLSKTTKKD
jgi:hypothetical protein